jgi:membrane fusion protein (multidrug efflux system)
MTITLRNLLWAAVPSVLILSCQGSRQQTGTPAPSPSNPAPLSVATAPVTRGPGAMVETPARIRSKQRAVISSRTTALVVSMPFREGDTFRKGDILVRLDDAPQRAAVSAAEIRLVTVESESRRVISLLGKGAATTAESDEVKARLEGARAALASARDLLEATRLSAPFSGRIASKSVNAGDVALSGAPLLQLQGGSALELIATLEPGEAGSIHVGQKLQVRVDGVERAVEAVVYSVAPAADETTHRVDVLCNLGPAASLKPGLFARLDLPSAHGPEAVSLRVPRSAVLRRGGLTGVFVVEAGQAWLRWIALGRETGDQVEVRAGLHEGERVAVAPEGLTDGMRVALGGPQ